MSTTKQALAAAAFVGLAGALLSSPALAIVSPGADPVRSIRSLHPGIYLAMEAAKKKVAKTSAKTSKAKKATATAKGKAKGTGPGSGTGTPSSGGGGDYQ
jgi:hypothetical protein